MTLYKCVDFPGRWERHTTLLSGFELADATIVRHDGLYYLLGATRLWRGRLFGHLVDLPFRAAVGALDSVRRQSGDARSRRRPAGLETSSPSIGGCGALSRTAPTVMDAPWGLPRSPSFRQPPSASCWRCTSSWPGPLWPGRKLHTLNRCGRLELIDTCDLSRNRFIVPISYPNHKYLCPDISKSFMNISKLLCINRWIAIR